MWLYSIQRFIMHVWDKKEREREKKCQTVQRRKGGKKQRKAEVGEQMAEWQDNKLLILCVRLVKEMETVKSQSRSMGQHIKFHSNWWKLCD